MANVKHNHFLHSQIVVLSITTALRPRVPSADRADGHRTRRTASTRSSCATGSWRSRTWPPGSARARRWRSISTSSRRRSCLGAETIRVTKAPGMALWREHLFAFLTRNATPAAAYFGLPLERTMTISTPVDI